MDYAGLALLIVGTLLFAFLAYRAARSPRRWLRFAGGVPAALLAVIFGAATVLAFVGYSRLTAQRPNPVPQLTAPTSPEAIAAGERFAQTCTGCHSTNASLPLTGQDFMADGPPVGTLWAPNLTPAHLAAWSDGEIVRAIREGVKRDGTSTLIMPSSAFHNMSDEDVLSLVAYLRSQPSAEPDTPPRSINVLGAIMIATVFPQSVFTAQPPLTQAVVAPPRARTAEYGGYLIHLGCQDCHGSEFRGGQAVPDGPPAGPDLVDFAGTHSVEEFVATLRSGIRPDGTPLSDEMPWRDFAEFSDDDFAAIALYLQAQR